MAGCLFETAPDRTVFFPWTHLRTCTDPSCIVWNIRKTDFQLTKTKSMTAKSIEMHRRLPFIRRRATTSNTAHFLPSRAHMPLPYVSVLRHLRPTGKPAPVPNTHAADLLPVPEALPCSWWFYGTYLSVLFKNLFPHRRWITSTSSAKWALEASQYNIAPTIILPNENSPTSHKASNTTSTYLCTWRRHCTTFTKTRPSLSCALCSPWDHLTLDAFSWTHKRRHTSIK